jgi:hypothetical protein
MRVDEISNNNVWDIHFSFDGENVTIVMDGSSGRFTFTGTIEE